MLQRRCIGREADTFQGCLQMVRNGLAPKLTLEGMISKPVNLLGFAVPIESLERLRDHDVKSEALAFEQTPICHFLGKRMLEVECDLWEHTRLEEELGVV